MDADLILSNGNIVTLESSRPKAEAVAVRCGRIVRVGSNKEIEQTKREYTRIIDLRGRTLMPGFIDSHMHPLLYGHLVNSVQLSDVKNISEFVKEVEERVKKTPPGELILGFGWNQELMEEKKYPTRKDIDGISPNNPVFLIHYNGHVYLANQHLLKEKNVKKDTPNPPGGEIDRDQNGEPTGILRERALDLIAPGFLESGAGLFGLQECKEALKFTLKKALEFGLTTICDAIADGTSIRAYQELFKSDELFPRVNFRVLDTLLDEVLKLGFQTLYGDLRLRFGGLKILLDGSLATRTAALSEPYSDDPGNVGIMRLNPEELEEIVKKAHKAGLQVDIHAIGDRAQMVAASAIEKALEEKPEKDHRFKVVHCHASSKEAVEYFSRLGIIASIQPLFIIKGQHWVPKNVGPKRVKYAHAWKTFLDNGIRCCAGTDAPIESMNPLINVYTSVTRKDLKGYPSEGYRAEECLTVDQAIRLVTLDGAYGIFEEDLKGTIREGKLADLVVLSNSPFDVPPDKIKDIKAETTIVGGRIAYSIE